MADLRSTKCKLCPSHHPNQHSLQNHYNTVHDRSLCPYCLVNRKVFLRDQKIYTNEELGNHFMYGEPDDTYGYIDGHPKCLFCDIRFYGEDELLHHLKKSQHRDCFLCKRKGVTLVFYKDYKSLQEHFGKKHFLCPHEACQLTEVVFDRRFELETHMKTKHGKKRKNVSLDLQQLMEDEGEIESDHDDHNNILSHSEQPSNEIGEIGPEKIVFVGVEGRACHGRKHGVEVKNYLSEREFEEFSGKFFKYKNRRNNPSTNHNSPNDLPSSSQSSSQSSKKKKFKKYRDPFLKLVYKDNIFRDDGMTFRLLEVMWIEFLSGKLKAVDFYIRFRDLFSQIKDHPYKHMKKKRSKQKNRRNYYRKRGGRTNQKHGRYNYHDEEEDQEEEERDEEVSLVDVYFPKMLEVIRDPKIFEALKAAKSTCDNKEYQTAVKSSQKVKYLKYQEEVELEKLEKTKRTRITEQNFPQLKPQSYASSNDGKYSSWNQPKVKQMTQNESSSSSSSSSHSSNKKKKKKNKNRNKSNQQNGQWNRNGSSNNQRRKKNMLNDLQKGDNNPMGGLTITVKKKKKKK